MSNSIINPQQALQINDTSNTNNAVEEINKLKSVVTSLENKVDMLIN